MAKFLFPRACSFPIRTSLSLLRWHVVWVSHGSHTLSLLQTKRHVLPDQWIYLSTDGSFPSVGSRFVNRVISRLLFTHSVHPLSMREALSSLTCEHGGPYFPSLPATPVETQVLRPGKDGVCHVVKSHHLQVCKLRLPGVKDLVQIGKARIKFHQ